MTTPRDLLLVAMDMEASRPVEQGDLSLALAGAEAIDLLDHGAIRLVDDRIVPSHPSATGDHLLDEAVSSLVRQEPYESVDDWLWRRGRGLSSVYRDALVAEGQLTGQRPRRMLFRNRKPVPADSSAHHQAPNRWRSHEPVLAALAAAVGIQDGRTADSPSVTEVDDAVATILAAVNGAVIELEATRQQRAIEASAFDNIWRGE
jgi:hypothetical protein